MKIKPNDRRLTLVSESALYHKQVLVNNAQGTMIETICYRTGKDRKTASKIKKFFVRFVSSTLILARTNSRDHQGRPILDMADVWDYFVSVHHDVIANA